jgi:hypothetical protein
LSKTIGEDFQFEEQLIRRIWECQDANGGFRTHYTVAEIGTQSYLSFPEDSCTNTETTSIILLADVPSLFARVRASDVKVGAMYYPWYLGEKYGSICDDPVIGWSNYWSNSTTLINKHLDWFKELRVDFLIVSWWSTAAVGHFPANYTNVCTELLFKTLESRDADELKLALIVEPFNETGTYNFTQIYDYVYDNFVTPYSSIYMQLNNKPLLTFFNAQNMTKNGQIERDSAPARRFEVRMIGSKNSTYRDWEMEVPSLSSQPVCVDGYISVMPRYDARGWKNDVTYAEGLYDVQWKRAINLAKSGEVKIVLIISWNEFGERTQIEPCIDATSYGSDPYLLFNATKKYIELIKSPIMNINAAVIILLVSVAVAVAAISKIVISFWKEKQRAR